MPRPPSESPRPPGTLFADIGRRAPTPRDTQYRVFRAMIVVGMVLAAVTFLWEWASVRPTRVVEVDMSLHPE